MRTTVHINDVATLSPRHLRLLKQSSDADWLKRIKALKSMAKFDDPDTFDSLLRALEDPNERVRATAAATLGLRKDPRAIPYLLKALDDRDHFVRMDAAESLGELITEKKSPPQLIKLLQDRNALVRITVAEVLGQIGDRKAASALRSSLPDRDPLVRAYAAEAVALLGSKRDIKLLADRLRTERSTRAKVGLLCGLYLLGEHAYLPAFLKLLESKNYRVRCAVANSLPEMDLDRSDVPRARTALRAALARELTIAAGGSIRNSLRDLRG